MTLVITIAIVGSLLLTPLARMLAWRFNAVSWPDGDRRLHTQPTALWGGSAVYLAVALGVAASYGPFPGTFNAMVLLTAVGLSTGMLCLLGCYDDRHEMRAHWKLFGQILSTLPVVLVGCYVQRIVLLGYCIDLGWLGVLFTMGWLVLGINAMNLLDGMDGLASTIGIAISVVAAVIAGIQGNAEATLLALALAGALAGFLVYNLPPARIYLGDCGSMVIGLAVSVLAIQVSLVTPRTANLTVAVSLLFIPLADTGLTIVRRTFNRRGLMVADRGHVHHRLLDRGFGIWKVLAVLGGSCLLTGVVAWSVALGGQEALAWGVLALLSILAVNSQLVGHEEWNLTRRLIARIAARLSGKPLPARWVGQPHIATHASPSPATGNSAHGETTPPTVIAGQTGDDSADAIGKAA